MRKKSFLFLISLSLLSEPLSAQSYLNDTIEKSKGTWIVPIPKYLEIQDNKYREREYVYNRSDSTWRFVSDSCYAVKAVFPGLVFAKLEIEGYLTIITKFGDYFFTYSNLTSVKVEKGETVTAGMILGNLRKETDGTIFLDFSIMKNERMVGLQNWFKM
jgi:hypothetical protein